ncbi:uncharacterized protein LOC135116644 [Helicoverpa armigera]|uniref:uncharacterized protein LOC135116644 n=1 Tax=Helicoverpa armigera TaxID=29058 RepID=UPI003082E843
MGSLISLLSNVMYLSEKLTMYLACTGLVTCLVITFIVSLGMGVGLGYNYCFVDLKTKVKYVPSHYQYKGSARYHYVKEGAPDPLTQTRDEAEEDGLRYRIAPPEEEDIESTTFLNMLMVQLGNNATPFFVYKTSTPDDNDDDDFTVTPSNTTSIANASRDSAEDYSETTVSSLEDNINELDEPTPEAPINSSNSNIKRVKKLVIPVNSLDLINLLSKLKAENKNYSLEIVTT